MANLNQHLSVLIHASLNLWSFTLQRNLTGVDGAHLSRDAPWIDYPPCVCISSFWRHVVAVAEDESAVIVPKAAKETIDRKEVMRVDHILAQLQRKVT